MASNLLVTGKWGEVHVTSAQQRNFNSGVVGDGQYVMNGLTATMSDSNTLHVNPGVACMNGADVEVPAGGVDVTVTNGTQGMLRNDLICVRYTMEGSTQKEKAELVCVRGTPAASDPQDPEYNDGSILDGSLVVDMPLYRVPLDGISVGDPEPMFSVLTPLATLGDSVSLKTVYQGNVNIYGSVIGVRVLYNKAAALLYVMTARVDGYMNTGTPGQHEFVVGTIDREFRPISDRSACLAADVRNGLSEGVTINADGTIALTVMFSVAMVGYNWGNPCATIPLL